MRPSFILRPVARSLSLARPVLPFSPAAAAVFCRPSLTRSFIGKCPKEAQVYNAANPYLQKPLPGSTASPAADPLIVLQNYIAIDDAQLALASYSSIRENEAQKKRLSSGDLVGLLRCLARHPGTGNKQAIDHIQADLSANGIKVTTELHALLIQAFALIGNDVGAALQYAHSVKEHSNGQLSVELYNALIESLVRIQHHRHATIIYGNMVKAGVQPNDETLALAAQALALDGALDDAVALLQKLPPSHPQIADTYAAIISGYGKLGRVTHAYQYMRKFEKISTQPAPPAAWEGLFEALDARNNLSLAIETYRTMRAKLVPASPKCLTSLISVCARVDGMTSALRYYHKKEHVRGWKTADEMDAALIRGYVSQKPPQAGVAWRHVVSILKHKPLNRTLIAPLAEFHADKHTDYLLDMLQLAYAPAEQLPRIVALLLESFLTASTPHLDAAKGLYQQLGKGRLATVSPSDEVILPVVPLLLFNDGKVKEGESMIEKLEQAHVPIARETYAQWIRTSVAANNVTKAKEVFFKALTSPLPYSSQEQRVTEYNELLKGLQKENNAVETKALLLDLSERGLIPDAALHPEVAEALEANEIQVLIQRI
ncbi:uncharacterized protein BJ171DRAFT_496397 [Polychytrium aggregatum]|uniref:uncharacterized protein n=1 Tax=Polychytrium aggregatum TaxID=110093 RepID=UPI0022FEC1D7|nr:uncharacterized protein BJ171DRAFT_496397 [Polychytrium aggregatum]KAI9206628.1 hypothetical protein BJ171DRAFT_496397 [Polychytrium aggregatum]